jgi:hypothetical protein
MLLARRHGVRQQIYIALLICKTVNPPEGLMWRSG